MRLAEGEGSYSYEAKRAPEKRQIHTRADSGTAGGTRLISYGCPSRCGIGSLLIYLLLRLADYSAAGAVRSSYETPCPPANWKSVFAYKVRAIEAPSTVVYGINDGIWSAWAHGFLVSAHWCGVWLSRERAVVANEGGRDTQTRELICSMISAIHVIRMYLKVWRAEFSCSKRIEGCIKGYRRVFYQGSTDHRYASVCT